MKRRKAIKKIRGVRKGVKEAERNSKKIKKEAKKSSLKKKRWMVALYFILGAFLIGMIVFSGVKPFLASLLGAVAIETRGADLSSYPEMFVSNGTFKGYFVVGEAAKVADSLTMMDIISGMKIKREVTAGNDSVSGDAWKVGDGNQLEMANNDASADSIQGENLRDISRYIGKEELSALADRTYKTRESSYTYKQYLYFDTGNTGTNELVKYAKNDKDEAGVFFFIGSGDNIGQYKLEFSQSAKSDIRDMAGSASSSGTVLKEFESTQINMLSKEFAVVLARRLKEDSIQLTLMGGAVSGSLLEGATQTYLLNGTTYKIGLNYVDNTYVKFSVNDQFTDKLQVGDTYRLADGNELGVREIMYQSYGGGIHSASFFLGADKLVLKDSNVTDTDSDSELSISGKTISGADVIITGTDDGTVFALSTIMINMTAQDDYYIGAGDKLSKVIEATGDDSRVLFTNNWDIEFKGLSSAKSHEIKLDSSSDRKYKLVFYDGEGNKVDLPLFYAVSDSAISFGEGARENCLNLKKGVPIHKDDYFVLTEGDVGSGSARSFALQYKGADRSSATSPKIKFKNLGSGKTLEYSVDTSSTEAGSAVCDIRLGGYTFSIVSNQAETSDDFQILIPGTEEISIVDSYGAQIQFSNIPVSNCRDANVTSSTVSITTADSSDYGDQAPAEIVLTVGATATSEVTVNSFTVGGTGGPLLGEGSTAYGYTSMGGKITYTSSSGSPNSFTYDYPQKQKLPLLYVTSKATTRGSSSEELAAVTTGDVTRLDSEITNLKAQNLIVVGGACVNTVAAELEGNPADCLEGLTPGKARIKLFKNGESIAMLITGYSSAETRLAGEVLAHRWTELSGSEVEIEGTTYGDAGIKVITKG